MYSTPNIWVAAADGDLARVALLVEHHAVSPNAPDQHTYTPMHAAASYSQRHVLDYLISHGGDVNITDNDGDTPLYTVEDIDTARLLVDHGAVIDRRNAQGISPIEYLSVEYGHVAEYLQSVLSPAAPTATPQPSPPSQYHQNAASEQLTSALMASVQDIMQRADADGHDPDEELRQVVSRTVLQGVVTGFEMTTDPARDHDRNHDTSPAKRPKTDAP